MTDRNPQQDNRRSERRKFHQWRWLRERRSGFDRRARVANLAT